MKKYLMIGFAAVAFAACSNHDFETYSPEQVVKAEYDAKFISEFGQPAANQNWGFGASTRALTRGVFANGNEWAANDRADCMYRVPPRLTEAQEKVVIKYFQTHKNLGYEDPKWTDYFIQQVYKGYSAPLSGTAPDGLPYSPEAYKAANGTTEIIGSDKMNHLAAIDPNKEDPETGLKPFVDHNYNFNKGDCGNGYPDVLDFKGTLTTIEETYSVNDQTHRHSDKINLMTNSTTKSFGYYNSDGSVRRTEYTRLVSYKTIMQEMGAEADCLNDGWNRSFMGFDYEMMVGPELYQDRYVTINDFPGNAPQYIYDGENAIKWFDVTYDDNWQPHYTFAEGYDEYLKIDGKKIQFLLNGKNNYAGTLLADNTEDLTNINQENIKINHDGKECVNLPLIRDAFKAGYLPTSDNTQDWVKVGGTADGYYSDWIVTLTEAKKYSNINYDGRIMAEDLSPQSKSDWDFNDIVFDYKINTDGSADILLQAAGGTLPLSIGGRLGDDDKPILDGEGNVANSQEVHALFGYTNSYPMINTGAGPEKSAVPFKLTDRTYTEASQILICVKKKVNGVEEWIPITAVVGKPAGKFVTNTTVNWVDEYANIKGAYPEFKTWVTTGTGRFVPTQKNDIYFDRTTRNEPAYVEE